MCLKRIIIICNLCLVTNLYAFDDGIWQRMFFSVQFHHQYTWANTESMKDNVNNPLSAYEVHLGLRSSGDFLWHRLYNLPSYGIGLYYSDLKNPEVFGELYSCFVFTEFTFGQRRSIQHRLKSSLGLSFFEKYYDQEHNIQNVNIGSRTNIHFNLNYAWFFPVTDRLLLSPGFSFTHFSNGAFKKPNMGVNIFDVNLGLRFKAGGLNMRNVHLERSVTQTCNQQHHLLMFYSTGFMQRNIGDPSYKVQTFMMSFVLQPTMRSRWGIGSEYVTNEYYKKRAKEMHDNPHFKEYFQIGFYASYHLLFNRIHVLFNLGAYLYSGYEPESSIFKRIGMAYRIGNNVFFQVALKAHSGRADHVQWGIGIGI